MSGRWAVLPLVLLLVLAGCGRSVAEPVESQDFVPSDTEAVKPHPETGTVPAEADGDAPEAGTAEVPQPAAPTPPAPPAPSAPPASSPAAAPEASEPLAEEDLPDRLTYVCYDGLYYVDYDPHDFTPGPTGGADLVKADGTAVFFARLPTPELTRTWLTGMEEKEQDPLYLSFESFTEQAAGYPVRAVVYQDETAWHAEAVVELREDRGSPTLPMYAVYFTCDGPSRQAVWTDGVEAFLSTLRLGAPGQ